MERKIVDTGDGSKTIHLPEWNESYHSSHGAFQEARHVFIKHGLDFLASKGTKSLDVLEMGFGTGLNAWLTLMNSKVNVDYIGVEAYPLAMDEFEQLSYADEAEDQALFSRMHEANWGERIELSKHFRIEKVQEKFEKLKLADSSVDLIYFDAFGPRVQPNLWDEKMMRKMFAILRPTGVLVTYCAQGQFKRNLKSAGFEIESLEGPPGKREMTRAIKPPQEQ